MSNFLSLEKINYIRNKFKEYYQLYPAKNIIEVSKREFGIGDFGKKISRRHLFFSTVEDFNSYLQTSTPFFVSYSVGYYTYPDRRPMEKKEWYGADIVYEFDSDDFDLPCHHRHNVWLCKNKECNDWGYGNPSFCEKCKSQVQIIEWTCDECLDKAKEQTIKLILFLEKEFKLDPSTFIISFSGSKGYHVRITDRSILNLSKSSRLQLMNYILGINLNLEQLGFVNLKKVYHIPDPKTAMGWSKKILDFIINTIENSSSQELSKLLDITYRKAKTLKENKEVIIKKMYHNNIFSNDFKLSDKFWLNFINKAIDSKSLKIDPQSSSDIYKIMRVPDTIHGGTGFLSTTIKDIDALKKFDAFSDPVIFDSENKIKIKIIKPTPKFRIFKEYYGPYTFNDIVEVKEGIAIFLVLKGVADFERWLQIRFRWIKKGL